MGVVCLFVELFDLQFQLTCDIVDRLLVETADVLRRELTALLFRPVRLRCPLT